MTSTLASRRTFHPEHASVCIPFPLPVVQGKKLKKKCCKKFKKGKRCKRCPAHAKKN